MIKRIVIVFLILLPSTVVAQTNSFTGYATGPNSFSNPYIFNYVTPTTPLPVTANQNGITPVVSASAEASHVLKATAGTLWGVSATNLTSTAGFLVVLNATSAPGDGAITPLTCVPLPSNGAASINYNSGPPATYSTGITAVVTSSSTCFTKTTGVITAFISGAVQ